MFSADILREERLKAARKRSEKHRVYNPLQHDHVFNGMFFFTDAMHVASSLTGIQVHIDVFFSMIPAFKKKYKAGLTRIINVSQLSDISDIIIVTKIDSLDLLE